MDRPPPRTPAQLEEHFRVERELADRLRSSPTPERLSLYRDVYDELYRRVPHHPQLTWKRSETFQRHLVDQQEQLLAPWVGPDSVFLELGPGDCGVTLRMAGRVAQVVAVDVSEEVTRLRDAPANVDLRLTDGCEVPVEPGSVDVAYSNQLMEHLHPEDAHRQLANVFAALKPGGVYVCLTPNRWTGPHDVTRHFGPVARGLHLREYASGDLRRLFAQVGFADLRWYGATRGRFRAVPGWLLGLAETGLRLLPYRLRRRVADLSPVAGWIVRPWGLRWP